MTRDELAELASGALAGGEEAIVLGRVREGAFSYCDARLHQWAALLCRSLDEHEDAIAHFKIAAELAPDDALIAHGLARTVLEAGRDARDAFARARALAPGDGALLLGQSAAWLAQGEGERAATDLAQTLAANPMWTTGHAHLAQLQALIGRPERATSSLDAALAVSPRAPELWIALFDLAIGREDYAELRFLIDRSELDPATTRPFAAIAESELGHMEKATQMFAGLPPGELPVWRIRHALRTGNLGEAMRLIDRQLAGPGAAGAWPYAYLAWRAAKDPRSAWLATDAVQVINLAERLPLGQLTELLRSLHSVSGQYLDQSVRGGTQTDGPLLSRSDLELREARAVIVDAVKTYSTNLPESRAGHPLLAPRRDRRIRFAGSWSVRLSNEGYHAPHVHPQGWISSALYVSLPAKMADTDGWLEIGASPPDLNLGLEPTHLIEPRPGRLVLFPSWLWHGTRPFGSGERLTIAFDVAPPR